MLRKLKHKRQKRNQKRSYNLYLLLILGSLILVIAGFILSWYIFESCLIKVNAGSVEGFLVISILTLVLVTILMGTVYLLKQMNAKIKDIKAHEIDNSEIKFYPDLDSISPLFKTFHIIIICTASLISLIIIGLVIIAVTT